LLFWILIGCYIGFFPKSTDFYLVLCYKVLVISDLLKSPLFDVLAILQKDHLVLTIKKNTLLDPKTAFVSFSFHFFRLGQFFREICSGIKVYKIFGRYC
jgi:hypothetical protein